MSAPVAPARRRRTLLLGAALPLLAACASGGGSAGVRLHGDYGVRIQERWSFYEVRGETDGELAASLARSAPPLGPHRVYGLTDWSVRWEYGVHSSSVDCRVEDPRVHVELETTLPRWPGEVSADLALRERWRSFVAALRRHEEGHRELAVEAGNRIVRELSRLRDLSCDRLERRADEAARAIVQDYDGRHHAYDQRTRGGETQGVVWP